MRLSRVVVVLGFICARTAAAADAPAPAAFAGAAPPASNVATTGVVASPSTTVAPAAPAAPATPPVGAPPILVPSAAPPAIGPAAAPLAAEPAKPATGGALEGAGLSPNLPQVGSVNGSGLYTAPATVPAAVSIAVIATSVQDPSKKASAVISLSPPVSVSVTPATVSLLLVHLKKNLWKDLSPLKAGAQTVL